VHGNYLKRSVAAAGLDPDALPEADKSKMNFGSGGNSKAKAWRDIWGAGQGVGQIFDAPPAAEIVARLKAEYDAAPRRPLRRRDRADATERGGGVTRVMSSTKSSPSSSSQAPAAFAWHLYRSDTRPEISGRQSHRGSGQPTDVRTNAERRRDCWQERVRLETCASEKTPHLEERSAAKRLEGGERRTVPVAMLRDARRAYAPHHEVVELRFSA
jgi:hypothetical protein